MKLGDKVMNKLTGRQMETRDVDLNQMVNLPAIYCTDDYGSGGRPGLYDSEGRLN